MSDENLHFTADQVVTAQRALRAALGLQDERFPLTAFIGMISDEIEQLRQAGRSDQDVVDIVAHATGVRVEASDIERFYTPPELRHGPHDSR